MNLRSRKVVLNLRSKKKRNSLHAPKKNVVSSSLTSKSLKKTVSNKEIKSQQTLIQNYQNIYIHVKVYTGRIMSLMINDNEKIGILKLKIRNSEEIPEHCQRIVFCQKELQDNKCLKFYDIKNDSTLLCEAAVLVISAPENKMFELAIKHKETVGSIKQKLQRRTKIALEQQRLFYPCCSYRGRQLDDTKSIAENGLEGNIIHLVKSFGSMEVFIEVLDTSRKIINFKVKKSDTIEHIKMQAEKKIGSAANEHSLFYLDNYLGNDKTYRSYGFENGTVLQMCKEEMIYVKIYSGEKIALYSTRKFFPIRDLKTRIKSAAHTHIKSLHWFHADEKDYRIFFHGQLLEDDKTLAHYNIGYGMKIEVYFGKRFYISSPLRSKLALEVRYGEAIESVKKKLQSILVVPSANQTIMFCEKELEDDFIMDEIEEFSNLNLILKTGKVININVIFENQEIALNIDNEFTVDIIILMVQEKLKELGSPQALDNYKLVHNGQPLSLSTKFSDLPNSHEATFHLLPDDGTFIVKIVSPANHLCKFRITKSTKAYSLQKAVERLFGILIEDQRLYFKDMRIQPNDTLSVLDIKNDDTIFLFMRQVGC